MKRLVSFCMTVVMALGMCSFGIAAERDAETFKKLDVNNDGKLTLAEFSRGEEDKDNAKKEFNKLDKDNDKALTQEEYTAAE